MRIDGRVWFVILLEFYLMRMAIADQWKISGALDQGVEYDDNISLRVIETPVFGYSIRPSVKADWSSSVMELGISGRGDIRRYDDERWDCDNFSLEGDQRYIDRRHVFSLTGSYSQSCSYSQQASDTGILLPGNQSENYNLAPTWVWQMTQRDSLSVRPNFSQTTYTSFAGGFFGPTTINLRNNKSYGLNLSEEHQWHKRLSSNTGLFFSHSEFSSSGAALNQGVSSQDVFGFQLGGQYALSRSWSINFGGGGRWVQTPGTGSGLSFGEIADIAIIYKGRRDNYSFTFSRAVSPSSFGQIQDVSSLGMKYGYELSRELSLNINGSYSDNQLVGQSLNQFGRQKREYYEASTELVWKLAREWRLSASYRFRMQDYATEANSQSNLLSAGARDSNAVMLHLNYNWDGLRDAR